MCTSDDGPTSGWTKERTRTSDGSAVRTATPPGASTAYSPTDSDPSFRGETPGRYANQPDDAARSSAWPTGWPTASRRSVTDGRPAHELPSPRAIAMRSASTALLVL